MSMEKRIRSVTYNGENFRAIPWLGDFLPSEYEEFQDIGYFEDSNGYDLESVDTHFNLEPGRRYGVVRMDDWILKNSAGQYSHVSNEFFTKNFTSVISSESVKEAFELLDKKFPNT